MIRLLALACVSIAMVGCGRFGFAYDGEGFDGGGLDGSVSNSDAALEDVTAIDSGPTDAPPMDATSSDAMSSDAGPEAGSDAGCTTDCDDIVQIEGGLEYTCALKRDGRLYCWGGNYHWQASPVPGTAFDTATLYPATSSVARVTCGYGTTCVVRFDGSVACWGYNAIGQVGDGTTVGRQTPREVALPEPMVDIDSGFEHTCAVGVSGRVFCWGSNSAGQLGSYTPGDGGVPGYSTTPVEITGSINGVAIAVSRGYACYLTRAGEVYCFGSNPYGQLGVGDRLNRTLPSRVAGLGTETVVELAAGHLHMCARLASNGVRCWGYNGQGELGTGTTSDRLDASGGPALTDVIGLESGEGATYALRSNGEVVSWGRNSVEQRGYTGGGAPGLSPTRVGALTNIRAIGAGYSHGCAVDTSNVVRCWGSLSAGQLGANAPAGTTALSTVSGVSDATQITSGAGHTCALRAGGGVVCWGLNDSGQLGSLPISPATPSAVTGLTDARSIAAGAIHTCAIRTSGSVVCWGSNGSGQLGDGTTTQRTAPVATLNISNALTLALGQSQSCAIADGTVKCWGNNGFGQLGRGDMVPLTTPDVAMGGPASPLKLAVGHENVYVLVGTTVRAAGANFWGQLAQTTTGGGPSSVPLDIPGLGSVVRIVTSGPSYSACAIRSDDTATCWGGDGEGSLGRGSVMSGRVTPATPTGLPTLISMAVGISHTAALGTDGRLYTTGQGFYGALGDGTRTSRTTVQTGGIDIGAGAAELSVTGGSTCIRYLGGAVRCVGRIGLGELGDGRPLGQAEPAIVPFAP